MALLERLTPSEFTLLWDGDEDEYDEDSYRRSSELNRIYGVQPLGERALEALNTISEIDEFTPWSGFLDNRKRQRQRHVLKLLQK
jgi:hypothetical protein